MSTGRGVFVVIEGTDGSGKGTQFKLLADRLVAEGFDVETFDFPQYEKPSSYFVREYLNGKYGTLEEVGPYTASLFYALDRFEASQRIHKALEAGKVVLANRFVGSSMAHQGTKFRHAEERRGYFIWLDNLEFEMLRIPRPTLSFVLRVPSHIAQSLVDQKGERSYTNKKRDLHEADLTHLAKAVEVYDDMCQLFPKDFLRVDCIRGDTLMDVQNIHEILWQKLEPTLPPKRLNKRFQAAAIDISAISESVAAPEEPVNRQSQDNSSQRHDLKVPADLVTSLEGNVYSLQPTLSPAQAAAIIVQLSQRSDDLRQNILTTLQNGDQTSAIAAHLASNYAVVENASLLLSKKLEWSRLATYVERPTRLITYDQKDKNGNYHYFVPSQLNTKVQEQYRAYLDQIFNLYSEMVRLLAAHLRSTSQTPKPAQDQTWAAALEQEAREHLRAVLPVASTTDIALSASSFALESTLTHLLSDELPEARDAGQALLTETRKATPNFMEGAHEAEAIVYRANTNQALSKLARQYLPDHYGDQVPDVQLTEVWPRNESDLLADMLYASSNLPLTELRRAVSGWAYEQKLAVFEAYIGNRSNHADRPGRALEKAHYSWDLLCDFDTFRDLQRHRSVDALEWQSLTPRYGYEIPKIIEEADLLDQYEACFELSLRLYSLLQEAGHIVEAQYATLLGHKLRWKVTYNAREAFHLQELRTSPHNRPGVRRIAQAMHEKLADKHPLIASAMKFIASDA